ncbi:MAG: hypothetical protein ACFE9S_04250 [Candidatus Hermodarchaeota archaeon]
MANTVTKVILIICAMIFIISGILSMGVPMSSGYAIDPRYRMVFSFLLVGVFTITAILVHMEDRRG